MKKVSSLFLSIVFVVSGVTAKEGMWLPMFLKSLNQTEMQNMGMKLTAEDIYNVNKTSLKDAIISFGGFCTGGVVSDQGLILTNHHCGYGQIQAHSSVENDYLTNGYWASDFSKELPNEGLTATFIVRMEDVTAEVLNDIPANLTTKERQKQIREKMDAIAKKAVEGTHYTSFIRPFFYGNEYYMFITEVFKDIRLVGAPPSSIGKFGGDEDNWVWPRHTGDFSLFRIYADKDNNPAEYSKDNVPYQSKNHLSISLNGIKANDFTMVFGFPGATQEYITSYGIKEVKEVLNPKRIHLRREALDIMDQYMNASDEVRIKYASKHARIANYWKKWSGENWGLEKSNALKKKRELEELFVKATEGKEGYDGLMNSFEQRYKDIEQYSQARSYFIEIPYQKVEIIGLASSFRTLEGFADKSEEEQSKIIENLEKKVENHFKNYELELDKAVALKLLSIYQKDMPTQFVPKAIRGTDASKNIERMYDRSIFSKKETTMKFLEGFKSSLKDLKKDPAFDLMSDFFEIYNTKISPEYLRLNSEIDSLSKIYVAGLREFVPGRYYPDANSTMRVAYGKVEPMKPMDAVKYDYYTTTEGILEKYDPTTVDYNLPERLIEVFEEGDFGDYTNEKGEMPVCFIASNHTTGGNSGSPVINGEGQLIGLNFDRNWQGTMSDINYDVTQCRNISVDVRYILFIVDKFAGASHLINEMTLVKTD